MNIDTAKTISIIDLLRTLDHAPVSIRGDRYNYLSPIRTEKEPSFCVSKKRNEWYDFGLGQGGDIINLSKRLFETNDVSEVLSRLDKLNKFPQDITFQTFLLDRDNKVKVIGNPVHNLAVRDLYLKQMTGKISPGRDRIKTTAKAINSEVDFGAFSKSEEKTAVFEIENTGDNPLVILDISTTCGCTTANYDKHPAKPGERLRIEVRMTPKDTGFFDEIVTLKCNTASPVKVKIRGQVQEREPA